MEDCPELLLKELCCTCLSGNRKLFLLCRVDDGVNDLYSLLSSDTEAYWEGFYKATASLFICFECRAIMRRISRFRRQACVAQKRLTAIAEGRTDAKSMQCLSSLSSYHIPTLDLTPLDPVKAESKDPEVFVDCGPDFDMDTDLDDIPLSDLHSYGEAKMTKELESPDCNKQAKGVKQKMIKTRKVKKKVKEKYFTITNISEDEMMEGRRKKRLTYCYIGANFKCEHCLEGFEKKAELERHNDIYHTKDQRTTPQVTSPVSKPRNRILKDIKTTNGFKCPDCDKYFDNKNIRYKHIRRYHSEGFSCSVCGKRYPFKDNLLKHERLHQGPLPREECPTCHKMIRVDLVRTHARIHSARETMTCVQCDKSYISRASYENHLKYSQAHASQDVLKYKCSMCDKGYRSKGELRDHVNYQHLGKTQHKCPVCGKALATRRCITRHVRRAHHDIKESPRDKMCQQCGKAFRDKKGLREHEFIHTGERPLSCEICGCTFRQSASLYTHRKRVHKIYPQRKSVELVEPS